MEPQPRACAARLDVLRSTCSRAIYPIEQNVNHQSQDEPFPDRSCSCISRDATRKIFVRMLYVVDEARGVIRLCLVRLPNPSPMLPRKWKFALPAACHSETSSQDSKSRLRSA